METLQLTGLQLLVGILSIMGSAVALLIWLTKNSERRHDKIEEQYFKYLNMQLSTMNDNNKMFAASFNTLANGIDAHVADLKVIVEGVKEILEFTSNDKRRCNYPTDDKQ